jgi:uncharacterized protein (TIGR02001 family)
MRSLLPGVALAAALFVPQLRAETTANFGWVSEYLFRGVFQEDSSAFGGLDYAGERGFYAGVWGADVGAGLETDLYFGFAGGERVTYKVGFTGYYYTDDFDDTYQEVNVGVGYGLFALDIAAGEWDGFGAPADYMFTSVTVSPEKGPYFKLGRFGQDFSGDYFEIGYAWSLQDDDVDLTIALTTSDDLNVNDPDDLETGDYALVFGVKKTLTLGDR